MNELLGIDLFHKVVERSVAVSFLILAVFLLRPFIRKAPRWLFCLLWGMVAVRLVMPIDIQSDFSLVPRWTFSSAWAREMVHEADAAMESVAQEGAARDANLESVAQEGAARGVNLESVAHEGAARGVNLESGTQEGAARNTEDNAMPWNALKSLNLRQSIKIARILWTCGMIAMLCYAFASYIRMRRKVSGAREISKGVYETKRIAVPFILGVIRPRIYLPEGLSGEARDYVLCHERAHLFRGDQAWKPLGFLLLSVYWFHPLVWISYHLFCKDVEMACDEKATGKMGFEERADYCQTLLDVSVGGRVSYACPLSFGEGDVKSRIRFVLNQKKTPLWRKLAFLLPCICLGLFLMTSPKGQAAPSWENKQNSPVQEAEVTKTGKTEATKTWEADAFGEESLTEPLPYESSVSKEIMGMEEASVLLGDLPIYYAQDGEERAIRLTDFPGLFHEEEDPYFKIWCFYVVDLDGDGAKEVVLQCYGVSAASGGRVILHQIGDKIYAYTAGWRTMWELYQDGSYFYSLWASDSEGYARITEFTETGYVEDRYTYATGTYEGTDGFVVDHEPALEGDYLKAQTIQRSKSRINGCPFQKEYLDLIANIFQAK